MGTIHNIIEKFGRRRNKGQKMSLKRLLCVGFHLSLDGSYDLQNIRIKNIRKTSGETNVATRTYVDKILILI